MDHFLNPRNTGELSQPTCFGTVVNEACGDVIKLSMRIDGGIVREAAAMTFGCVAAIAAASVMTEMVRNKGIREARAIDNEDIVKALGGLPSEKSRCTMLAELAKNKAMETL